MFGQLEPLGKIQIAPNEIGTAQRVSAEVAELTIRRAVTARASAGAWIDRGDESVRVEPLDGSRLRDPRDRIVLIHGHARYDARILRTAALDEAVSIRRIRCAQNREWQTAVPKRGARNLPSVQ